MLDLAPVRWMEGKVSILDQRELPFSVRRTECARVEEVAEAIRTLAVRGAPAIGIAAGYAVALAAKNCISSGTNDCHAELSRAGELIKSTRPTARNLFWAVDKVLKATKSFTAPADIAKAALSAADGILADEVERDSRLSKFGSEVLMDGYSVLTHCNTGELATGGMGSALGVLKHAWASGKKIHVYATETRPLLQGARLTTLELANAGIPATLLVDSAVGYLMQKGLVNAAIVGADRILSDGSTANKIGTYAIAVLAKEHGIPFYVAAPLSTFDLERSEIPIELRSPDEVRGFRSERTALATIEAWNPAFDITPPRLITGIITESGVLRPPYRASIAGAFQGHSD
jgi:methylthioribose-1-phosphate isomerase